MRHSGVNTNTASWLWKPFIAYGKITTIQGDPGERKSSVMLNSAAAISNGGTLPDGSQCLQPLNVIYQCFCHVGKSKKDRAYLPADWRNYFSVPVEDHEQT